MWVLVDGKGCREMDPLPPRLSDEVDNQRDENERMARGGGSMSALQI